MWGGDSLAKGGFDCSGLVYYAYQCVGLTLPRIASAQRTYCMNNGRYTTNPSEFQYGDLVFYNGHVAFYVGNNTVFGAQTFGTPAGYGTCTGTARRLEPVVPKHHTSTACND